MLYKVAVVKEPTVLAQQAGETEEIIVPSVELVASSDAEAILRAGAANAAKITDAKGNLRVIVKAQG